MTTHTPEHLEEKLRADLPASFVKVSCHSQLPPVRTCRPYPDTLSPLCLRVTDKGIRASWLATSRILNRCPGELENEPFQVNPFILDRFF